LQTDKARLSYITRIIEGLHASQHQLPVSGECARTNLQKAGF